MRTLIAVVLLSFANVSWAIPVQWQLDFQFDDGGSGSGSFYFDADTNNYSAISLVTTAGSLFSGETYNYLMPSIPSGWSNLYVVAQDGGDLTGVPGLAIDFGNSLANVNSIIPLVGFAESFCVDSFCSNNTEVLRGITSGTASSVPIPAAVWLFGSALAGLGWMRRKQAV
jgi:hypothetical protein